ncbi:hypothetical protein [Lysinibacillus sp. FSL K6-3209]|uniref:hypothetical protein n=1 Tax=Lysinibacillus sp. FSL K6-3209 TaxID=2921497 RepID=UPI0030DA66AD
MKLNFPGPVTKDEFLNRMYSFLSEWGNDSSTRFLIGEFNLSLIVDGKQYDVIGKDRKEAVFHIGFESEEVNEEDSSVLDENQPENEDCFIELGELTEWMFIKSFNVLSDIEDELVYVGDTKCLYDGRVLPVYSIETYCHKRGLAFIKEVDYTYVQQSVAAELISKDLLNTLKTTAIYLKDGLEECINRIELEEALGEKIYTSLPKDKSLVTIDNIVKMTPYLNIKSSIGKLYRRFYKVTESNWNCFENIYDLNSLMEENSLSFLSEEEYNKKRFIEFISSQDLNAFPKKMQVKEKADVFGGRIEKKTFGYEVKPFFRLDQILNDYSDILYKEVLKNEHLCCPIRYLHKLKQIANKEGFEYNNLLPLGVMTHNHLVFDNIPTGIKVKMEQFLNIKEMQNEIEALKRNFYK